MRRPTIGLALSGGSAKGFAHIGVIKVLEEAGIPIDYIAGTSMGALVGAYYAARKDINEMEKIALTLDRKQMMRLIDLAFNGGLIGGEKVYGFFEPHLRGMTFEKCHIPLRVVATDLKTAQPVIFHDGELLPAVRASISLPIIFTPVTYRDLLLADGGLSIPLPARIVRDMGADVVIAVNVLGRGYTGVKEGTQGLRGLLNLADASIDIMMHNLAKRDTEEADIVIEPNISGSGSFQFDQSRQFIELGEQAGRQALSRIEGAIASKTPVLQKLINHFRSLAG
jgi:NTE family protein